MKGPKVKLLTSIVFIFLLIPAVSFSAVDNSSDSETRTVLKGNATENNYIYCLMNGSGNGERYVVANNDDEIEIKEKIVSNGSGISLTYQIFINNMPAFMGCSGFEVSKPNAIRVAFPD